MEWKLLWVVLVALLLGGWGSHCDGCWDQEKTALLQLKPFFSHIKDIDNWGEGNQSSNCCEWERVECNTFTGRVIQLNFDSMDLWDDDEIFYWSFEGDYYRYLNEDRYLNASLFLPFEELKSFNLSGNSIAGCVENQGFEKLASKLDKLEIFDLSDNNFDDSILASLSQLLSLKSLNLARNQFAGSNSSNGFAKLLSKLDKLEILDLSDNNFDDSILASLSQLSSLKSLNLARNQFAGSNSSNGFAKLSSKLDKLEILDLSDNNFDDSILASLSQLSSLKSLNLARNQFAGSNPSDGIKMLSILKNLETLDLSGNMFGNNIISKLESFKSLRYLSLQNCGLQGTVQMLEFNNLTNLKELYLDENEIISLEFLFQDEKGELKPMIKLEVLGLNENLFNNSILSFLGSFSNLKSLNLRDNRLEGPIQIKELNALSNLEKLYIPYNQVNDFVPSQDNIELRLMNLDVLDLHENFFNNSILSSLNRLSNLKSLYLSYNNLKGSIDLTELNALIHLENLAISCGDDFYRSIDSNCSLPLESLASFPSLKTLSLAGFSFQGAIMTSQNTTELMLMNLEELYLSENLFNNNILPSLNRLSSLKSLVLYYNNLKGSIDLTELNALTHLESLKIVFGADSSYSFSLESLVLFSSLKTLFLQGFSFQGAILTSQNTTELRLMKLEELYLSYNLFNNNILSSLNRLSNLKSLVLYYNNLKGSIDLTELNALTHLESLEIGCGADSNCSLSLQSLALFPSLKTLVLAGFSFQGTIMTSQNQWHNFTNLEYLILDYSVLQTNFLHSIREFTSLKHLELFECEINGSLSLQESHNFTNLEELIIMDSIFQANFLQSIGQFTSLRSLQLSDYKINGSLTFPGFCELTNLQHLDMSYSNLKGDLPDCFSNLTSLQSLDLSSNQFSGNINALESLTSLRTLDLSSNQFSGNISALKSLASLQDLRLSNNYFQIPMSLEPLFNLSKLKRIFADNNTIYAETQVHSLAPKFQLKGLNLSCCGDVGSFPEFLYHQQNLQYLDLSNIHFKENPFPNWLLENNTQFQTLILTNSSLSGPLQLPLASHMHLTDVDISNNFFNGSIPAEIGAQLPSLTFLNMSKNYFNGRIPSSFGDMSLLETLDLSNNQLTGEIPKHLAKSCSSLQVLALSNNKLQGKILSGNSSLTNLSELQLDGNNFSGSIPDFLSQNPFLLTIDVSNNQLSGRIPRWMGNMSYLEKIVMSNNHLEGTIPVEFCQLDLIRLDLSVNNISGSLPSCFNPAQIRQVHLSKNRLRGALPDALRNSSTLVTLDISYNSLTGSIPSWIGGLSNLSYLLLSNNEFEGEIPMELCNLSQISLINLSHNNLSGHIPRCLKITTFEDVSEDYVHGFTALGNDSFSLFNEPIEFPMKNRSNSYKGRIISYIAGIDLSCNKLVGEIPYEFGNFYKILVLNLSHNSLTGPIPPTFANLKQIESLDLSHNNLSGNIPPQLVRLTFLSYFIVAFNNLSGKTPERIAQFGTFDESSYKGNPFLCGEPLPKCANTGPPLPMPNALTDDKEDDGLIDMGMFYVSFIVSYTVMLLAIVAVLYINPYWRRAWFYRVEIITTSCYYFVVDNVLPRRFHCGNM